MDIKNSDQMSGVTFVETIFNTTALATTHVFSEIGDRYLIDPSESSLRSLLGKEGISLNKTRIILLTSLNWDDIGGMIGVCLTLSTFDFPTKIYGPPGIKKLFQISKGFNNVLNIHVEEISIEKKNLEMKNEVFTVIAVPTSTEEIKLLKKKQMEQQRMLNTQLNKSVEFNIGDEERISYIFHSKDIEGRFDIEKAKKLNVKDGRKIRQLVRELSPVMNDDPINPRLIQPSDVIAKPAPGTSFAFINCPSEEYFQDLFNDPAWDSIKDGKKPLTMIYHKTPPNVMENPKYLQFIESISHVSTKNNFTKTYSRISDITDEEKAVVNEDGSISPCSTRQILLHKEFTEIEDVLKLCNLFRDRLKILLPALTKYQAKSVDWKPISIDSLKNLKNSKIYDSICTARDSFRVMATPIIYRGAKIVYRESYSHVDEIQFHHDDYFLKGEGGKKARAMVKLSNHLDSLVKDKPESQYPKTLFLGTASSVPSEHRNVTGILISSDENNHFLLDCGESTLIQMERYFGRNDVKKILIETKMIWISHFHADHHLGVISFIKARMEALSELSEKERENYKPIVIVAHEQFLTWINSYRFIFDKELSFNTEEIGEGDYFISKACESLGIKALTSVPVFHSPSAYGIVIDFNDGFRLTFSGDTRPCVNLEKAGQDSDLLIHESTFSHEELVQALAKRHSTLDEALGVSYNMRAKKTIVTHFSQRYQSSIGGSRRKVPYGVAYDLVRFAPYQVDLLYNAKDILDSYFQEVNILRLREREIIISKLPKSKLRSPFAQDNISSILAEFHDKRTSEDTAIPASEYHTPKTPILSKKLLKAVAKQKQQKQQQQQQKQQLSFTTTNIILRNPSISNNLNYLKKNILLQNLTLKSILMLKK
ncbi:hypothetical protein ACTA71_005187 [Dictyostelium dimigraforme]